MAVASDPDRDAVYGVDLVSRKLTFTVSLTAGEEPGRLAEDGAGHIHVALRGGGALVTIDPASGTVVDRRAVCPAPRGVAWDASSDTVWVACATGELVGLPAAGGAATSSRFVERDLRDVVVQGGALTVSTFRSAELLRLGADGTVVRRDALTAPTPGFAAHVAWRVVPGASGQVIVAHQVETLLSLETTVPGGYGGGCTASTPAVRGALDVVGADGSIVSTTADGLGLPVDLAASPDGQWLAIAAPGNAFVQGRQTVILFGQGANSGAMAPFVVDGQPTAVAFDAAGHLLVQAREPANLWVIDPTADAGAPGQVALSSVSRKDTGAAIFQTQAGAGIACASCHPEGGDDGHVWTLDGAKRRTPSLRGTIAGTAPYHWPGDQKDLNSLVADVYTGRMSGARLTPGQMTALTTWVQAIPAPPPPSWVDSAAASRGQTLFESKDVGCSSCHSGAKLTNNATVDVGTGGSFQVPPLVGVGWRTPLLHDGCAATFADRFGKCATPQHGVTGSLTASQVSDLTAYLDGL
jgi:cytochrome c553